MSDLTVWKYEFPVEDHFSLQLPVGAKILHIDQQHGAAYMWALVDRSGVEHEKRHFYVRGTGHHVPDGLTHIGTFLLLGGDFVGHLFEPVGVER